MKATKTRKVRWDSLKVGDVIVRSLGEHYSVLVAPNGDSEEMYVDWIMVKGMEEYGDDYDAGPEQMSDSPDAETIVLD